MADVNARFVYDADFTSAVSQVHILARELGVLNSTFNALDKDARKIRNSFADTFRADVADLGGFSTRMVDITSSVDNFGKALDKNKLKLRDYAREARKAFQANSNARKLAEDQIRRTKADLVELGMDANGRRKGILVTPMTLDMSDMQTKLEVARKQFSIFNKLVNDGATQLINWGKNTQWAGRQLTVGLTVPMTIFASTTIKAFNDVDRELTRFQKVYGSDLVQSVNQNTGIMRQQVQALAVDIAKSYGIAAKETAGLAADLAATGLEGQKLLDSVKQTTRLAVLGEIDRQDAMKTTLSLQNAFNMSTKQLSESIDFLNAVENQTSVSLQDLTEAIPKVGPVVRALGGDVKDLSVLLVAMKEGGINAAEGANALKSGLASLINPTKSASEVAKSYGIDLENIVKKNKGQLLPTVLEFQSSMKTLDELGKAKIIEQLFGKYQFARISALFDNLNTQGSQTREVIKLMSASSKELATIANQEIKTLTESSSMRFQRAMEGIKASLLPVGETIVRSVLPFMEKLSTVFDKIVGFAQNLPGPVKSFLKVVTGITAIAGPLIMMTGVLGNFLGYIVKGAMAFVNLGRKIKGLPTEKFELMDDVQIAAAKATDLVTQSIDKQKVAMIGLNQVMIDYYNLINKQAAKTPTLFTAPTLSSEPPKTESSRVKRINFIKRQNGGSAWVPGSGSGDKIPALLEPGEFVINRNAAKQYGGVLEDINRSVPRFATGGKIPGYMAGLTNTNIIDAPPRESNRNRNVEELPGSRESRRNPAPRSRESRRGPAPSASSKTWNPKFIFGLSKGENELINDLGFGKPDGNRKQEYINLKDRILLEIESMDIDPRQKSFIIKNLNSGVSPADLSSQLILAQVLESLDGSPEMRAISSPSMRARIAAARVLPILRARDAKSFKEINPSLRTIIGGRKQPWGRGGEEARDLSYSSAFDQFDIETRLPVGAIEESRRLGIPDDLAKIYFGSSTNDPSIRRRGTRNASHGSRFTPFRRIRMVRRQNGGVIKAIRGTKVTMPESYVTKLAKIRQSMAGANVEAMSSTLPLSELGARQSRIGGFSSAIPGVNGVYEINGQRFVVKGHDTYDSAKAEADMARITRDVFGLKTPNQEVVKIRHPETGELMFAVRSPYDEAFVKSTGAFGGDSVFDQIIAAAVRRDKDLQPDNLWDNIVSDVGQAGIMSKASQPRLKTGPQNAVLEQLAINLGLVKGGARSHGAEAWNRATSTMTDEQIISGIKRAAQTAKSKVSTANLPSDFAYISQDLDDIINADLLPYIAHLRTVMPKEKKPLTAAAIAKKELQKQLEIAERDQAIAAGYPEWALQSGGIIKRVLGGNIPRKNILSPINNKPFIGPLNYADYRGTDPKYPGSQFIFDKPGDLEDWIKAPHMVPVYDGGKQYKNQEPDRYMYSRPHWTVPQRMGSSNVLNYNDPKQEAFAKWVEGNQTAFRKDRRGSISILGYDRHREVILDQMSDLPSVSLSRATVLDSTKPMPEFTRSPIEPLMSALMGNFPLSQIIGQKINWTDLQSFSTKADVSSYGKFVAGRFQHGLKRSQEVINRKVESGEMMPVLFRFLDAKGQKGFNISQEAKVQNVWGKRVNEEEFILNQPSGTIDSIAQDIATKMYIVNLRRQGGAIYAQTGGAIHAQRGWWNRSRISTPKPSQAQSSALQEYWYNPRQAHTDEKGSAFRNMLEGYVGQGTIGKGSQLFRALSPEDRALMMENSGNLFAPSVRSTTRSKSGAYGIAAGFNDLGTGSADVGAVARIIANKQSKGISMGDALPFTKPTAGSNFSMDEVLLSPQNLYQIGKITRKVTTGTESRKIVEYLMSTSKPSLIEKILLKSMFKLSGVNPRKTKVVDSVGQIKRLEAESLANKQRIEEERQAAYFAKYGTYNTGVQTGGMIGLQTGGSPWVPGKGEGDRVPAMLEPGEFVVNKKAAKKFSGVLEDMNWNIAPRFQRGTPGLMPGMGSGAVSGGLMAMSMATSMMLPVNNFTEALNKSIMALSAFTGILSAIQMLGMRSGGALGGKLSGLTTPKKGSSAELLSSVGRSKVAAGKNLMKTPGSFLNGARLATFGAGNIAASGTMALATNPVGWAIAATLALTAAVVSYKKALDSAKKSATQTFKASKAEAEAYGVELKNINDTIKANQEYTKTIGAQAISYAGTVSTGMDPEKEKALLESNKDLTKRLRNLGETRLGTTISPSGDRSAQAGALLSAKYASLLQQGFDPVASNEIVKALAKEAGVLDQYTEAAKRFGSIRLEDTASLIRAQMEGLKTFENMSGLFAERGGFGESIKTIVEQINLLAPENQYEGLKELLNQIETLDTSKLEVAVRTLTQSAIDRYGRGSALGQALQSIENRTEGSFKWTDPTSWNNASDISAQASAQLAASLQSAYETGVITDEQLIRYKAKIEEDGTNEKTYSDIMMELDNATKKRDVLIEARVQFDKTLSQDIEKKNKEIIIEQNKLAAALEAKDEVIKNEEKVFQDNQKAGQKFIKAKQEEIDAINKGTDKYISSLEKRATAEDFYQNQQKTTLGGLSALASGDIFGFLESQQQIAQNAAQFGYDQEISKINEKRSMAVDAIQSEMDIKQKALELEAEGHDARMQQLSDERESMSKTGSKAIADLQAYSDALSGIQGNEDVTKWLGSMTDLQAQAANKMAMVNYLIAHPEATIQDAYRAVLAQSATTTSANTASITQGVTNKLKVMDRLGYSEGGYVSGAGTGTSDSIPARLSNGEYVIKASAVDQYGHGLLNAINEQKFAEGGPVDDYEKTSYSGKTFNKRTVRMLQHAEGLYGSKFGIYQGSYSTKIAASKGTHDGGGAVDIKPPSNINSALQALTKAGFWAKWRGSMNPPHIHAIAIGDKELSPQARRQLGLPADGSFNESVVESGTTPVVAGTTSRTVAQAISEMVSAGIGTNAELNNLVSMGAGAAYIPFNRRRFGGSMTMNKPYLVGENGPEVILPYGSGSRVSPKFSVPTGTNGIMVNTMPATRDINILIDGSRSPQEVANYVISEIRREDSRRSFGRGI